MQSIFTKVDLTVSPEITAITTSEATSTSNNYNRVRHSATTVNRRRKFDFNWADFGDDDDVDHWATADDTGFQVTLPPFSVLEPIKESEWKLDFNWFDDEEELLDDLKTGVLGYNKVNTEDLRLATDIQNPVGVQEFKQEVHFVEELETNETSTPLRQNLKELKNLLQNHKYLSAHATRYSPWQMGCEISRYSRITVILERSEPEDSNWKSNRYTGI